MEKELKDLKKKLDDMMLWVPNVPASDVPVGKDETENVVQRTEGKLPKFNFKIKPHVELIKDLDLADVERGTKVGGFRGYFLKNDGVELHQAILKYAFDVIKSKGFDVLEVPWLVRPKYLIGTGYFPWGSEDHYKTQDDLALIGTAEVSLTSFHADETLKEEDLPIKTCRYEPLF